jgi:diguanylate cyclase (GGDEF)-like protein
MPLNSTAAPTPDAARATGDNEVDSRFAEIGLTPRTGWYVSIALYAVGGIPAIAVYFIDPEEFPIGFMYLGALALLMSILSAVGLKFFPDSSRATHLRLGVGLTIQTVGAFSIGDARQAFILLPLSTLLPPAIYYGVREAGVYMVIGCSVIATSIVLLDYPWAWGMAVCSTTALASVTISMMIAQARTRRLATAHRQLAFTDPLTSLPNTRKLHAELASSIDRANDTGERFALFAIDLDDFKQVNDTMGHSTGDDVLKAVARALERVAGPGDLVARRGGDEFSLMVREPGARDLDNFGARMRDAIHDARMDACPSVTPSGSVAFVRSTRDESVAGILERADDELHGAKVKFHSGDVANRKPRLAILDGRLESERAEIEVVPEPDARTRRIGDGARSMKAKLRSDSPQVDSTIWLFSAMMETVLGCAVAVVAVLGLAGDFPARTGLISAGVFFAIAIVSFAGARLSLSRGLINIVFAVALITTIATIHVAGSDGAALLDLLAIPTLYAFHFFAPRTAVAYLLTAVGAYAFLAEAGSFPVGGARSVIFALMAGSSAILVAKVRSVTSGFIVQTWELSQTDALTGTANMRALRSRLHDAIARVESGKSTLAAIAIDLDEFKQVNDRFSHSVGDQALIAVSRAITDNVRADELVARRGGDEFLVLVEDMDDQSIDEVATRIAKSISRARRRICPDLVSTASVAWTRYGTGGDVDTFILDADSTLHDRKMAFGRDYTSNRRAS